MSNEPLKQINRRVEELIAAIMGELKGLESIRNSLEERLNVALVPRESQDSEIEVGKETNASPMATKLTEIRDTIAWEIRRIAEIVDRLDI